MKVSCKRLFDSIVLDWNRWIEENGIPKESKWVVAISGGKDSTVVAALAARKFGPENVVGVTLPCDGQKDFDDSLKVIDHLGIRHVSIDIGDAVRSLLQGLENNAIDASYDAKTNLPARVRMATTYAVAQSVGGIVLNTCNLTETVLGYCSLFGDDCGSYSPIGNLTVTEVIALGDWLKLPRELTHKTPIDGLQPLTDEEKLGMKYADVDEFIRDDKGTPELKDKVVDMYLRNRFKRRIVRVPAPFIELPNYVEGAAMSRPTPKKALTGKSGSGRISARLKAKSKTARRRTK